METYSHVATCSNCHKPQTYQIPKGTPISAFMAYQNCMNCGCPMSGGGPKFSMEDKGRVAGL